MCRYWTGIFTLEKNNNRITGLWWPSVHSDVAPLLISVNRSLPEMSWVEEKTSSVRIRIAWTHSPSTSRKILEEAEREPFDLAMGTYWRGKGLFRRTCRRA